MSTATLTYPVPVPEEATEQHSIITSMALHLLPGLLIGALFAASAPLAMRMGFPPLFAMVTAGVLAGLGFQLWHLLKQGIKRNGAWSLRGVVHYREPMPIWQYCVWVPA